MKTSPPKIIDSFLSSDLAPNSLKSSLRWMDEVYLRVVEVYGEFPWRKNLDESLGSSLFCEEDEENGRKWKREEERRERGKRERWSEGCGRSLLRRERIGDIYSRGS